MMIIKQIIIYKVKAKLMSTLDQFVIYAKNVIYCYHIDANIVVNAKLVYFNMIIIVFGLVTVLDIAIIHNSIYFY